MEIQIAVAKLDKFAAVGSGDTVEIIERPNGGVSVVLADGKFNNTGSKAISMKVVHRTIGLISEGIHDGAAARAVSNILYKENAAKSSASLNILSCDLQTNTLIITRSNPVPFMIVRAGKIDCIGSESSAIGHKDEVKPSIYQFPLEGDISIIMFTDGIINAGQGQHLSLDIFTTLDALFEEQEPTASEVAEFLLAQAVNLDLGQPEDDMCVVVLQTIPQIDNPVRRLSIKLPV